MTSGLVMERIRHSFGANEVLKDVSIIAEAGKLTCLLGPSGCGKTTLLRLAAGLETVQHGTIELNRKRVGDSDANLSLAPEKRDIGLMFQDYALFPHLNVFENIVFGIKSLTPERKLWVTESLERMGLAGHRNSYPHTLSGGQQQRVALLRALAPQPQILLLDEPFSGLDVTRRAQVREDTLNFLKDCGVAVLMVTHDPEEAMFMADHIVVMKDGKVVQAGTPVQTYFHPVDAYVAELFGPMNQFEGVVDKGELTTPLGAFSIPSIPDGEAAKVLVRMEGINVAMGRDETMSAKRHHAFGRIEDAYLLGRSTHLHIRIPQKRSEPDGNTVLLHVRVSGVMNPEAGASVTLWADPKQAFAFAAD